MPAKEPNPVILLKYGGNAMTSESLKVQVIEQVCNLREEGYQVVVVHGGGPFIRQTLDKAGIKSEFIKGHRKTTPEALQYVEMALKGWVNGELVRLINVRGGSAVGLSGKDGKTVIARKRLHRENGETIDLDRVGEVAKVNTSLLRILLDEGFLPVITCLASDENGMDYNINADLFAGSIAGALQVDTFMVLTDVDGLMKDINDPGSLIRELHIGELNALEENGVIKGGMFPKVEACRAALEGGAARSLIINGTKPEQIRKAVEQQETGTVFIK